MIKTKSENFAKIDKFRLLRRFFWIAIQDILLTGQVITSLITTGNFSTDKVAHFSVVTVSDD